MPDENPKEGDADHPENLRRLAELQAESVSIFRSLCRIRRPITDRVKESSAGVEGSVKIGEEKINK